jgi:RNA polymerase sigma-70 factor (ECF subfamily)
MGKLNGTDTPENLIRRARDGDQEALGRLLELYRNYLRLLASTQAGRGLKLRLDPSDLVQETFLEAHRDFHAFAGSSERELVTWLRRILVRNLADQARHHGAGRRDWRRQESLEAQLGRSSMAVHNVLAAGISSPSVRAMRRERAVLLADALASLPDDYREVIVLRNLLGLKFDEVAEKMGRSSMAVRLLWTRALEKLRHAFQEEP